MKKALFSIFTVCALFACNKVEKEAPVQEQGTPVTFNITVSGTDDTKAVKSAWVTGDVINIFFEGLEEKYLCITYNSEATPKWAVSTPNGVINSEEYAALGTKELTAVHFPVAVDVVWDDTNEKFDFTAGGKPVYNYYLLQENAEYTVVGNVVTVTLALGKPGDFVWFHVNGIQANPELYKLMEPSITPVACTSVAKTGGVAETLGTAGYPLTGIADADGAIYAGRKSTQTTYAFQLVKVNSETDMIAEGTYTKSGSKTFVAGKQYGLPAPDFDGVGKWTWNQWVDLGFDTNNVLWATGNLTDSDDISTPTGGLGSILSFNTTGKYYAYADLVGRSNADIPFTNANTRYYNGASFDKYTVSQELLAEDDAASFQLGDSWRIPTNAELVKMVSAGQSVKSPASGFKSTGPNGLSIFLKMSGYGMNGSIQYVGVFGRYGSATVYATDATKRLNLSFYFDGDPAVPKKTVLGEDRSKGVQIRPVKPVGY